MVVLSVVWIDLCIVVGGLERWLRLLDDERLDDCAVVIDLVDVDALGWAIELRVLEQCGRTGIVDDVERELVVVREQPRPRPMICLNSGDRNRSA